MSFCFPSKVTTSGSHCTWEQKVVLDTTITKKNLCLGKKSGKLSLFFEWRTDSFKNVCFCAFCIWTYSVCKMGTNKGVCCTCQQWHGQKWQTTHAVNKSIFCQQKLLLHLEYQEPSLQQRADTASLPANHSLIISPDSLSWLHPASSRLAGWSKKSKLPISLGLHLQNGTVKLDDYFWPAGCP